MGLRVRNRLFLFLRNILACAALLITATASLLAAPQTDTEKLMFLFEVRNHIPTLLSEAGKHKASLLSILDEQERVYELLKKNVPNYEQSMAAKDQDLWIEIQPKKPNVERTVNTIAFEAWRTDLLKTVESLPADQLPSESLLRRAQELAARTNAKDPSGLMTGLIQSLPAQTKIRAFKARTPQEKLDILTQELPAILPDGFKADLHGLPAHSKKEVALTELKSLLLAEEATKVHAAELQKILQALTLTRSHPSVFPSKAALQRQLQDITVQEVQKQFSKQNLKRTLEKRYLGKVGDPQKGFTAAGNASSAKSGSHLILKEKPPWIAIFRGYAGNDCASQSSFPYPNSSDERVFFIYDQAEKNKGYVSGSLVQHQGKRAFYLTTIAGANLSTIDARNIIQGLYEAREHLGVEQLMLPEKIRLGGFINHIGVRKAYEDVVANKPATKIQHLDIDARTVIDNFKPESKLNLVQYDAMANNVEAVLFEPTETAKLLEVKTQRQRTTSSIATKKHTKQDLLEMALDLAHSGQESDLGRLLKIDPTIKPALAELVDAKNNKTKFGIIEFEDVWTNTLQKHGLDPAAFAAKDYLLRQSRIEASDAAFPTHRDRTITALIDEIKAYEKIPEHVKTFIRLHHKVLADNPRFEIFLNTLVRGSPDQQNLWTKLINAGVEAKPEHWSVLRAKLIDSNRHTRWGAMTTIAQTRTAADELTAQVVRRLSTDKWINQDYSLFSGVTKHLQPWGEKTQVALIEAAHHPANRIDWPIDRIDHLSEPARQKLLKIYEKTRFEKTKNRAFQTIAFHMSEDPRSTKVFFSGLGSENPALQNAAIDALVVANHYTAEFITELNKHYSQMVKNKKFAQARSCLDVLTRVAISTGGRDRRTISALLYGFKNGDEPLKRATLQRLSKLANRDPRVLEELLRFLKNSTVVDQIAAAEVLARVDIPIPGLPDALEETLSLSKDAELTSTLLTVFKNQKANGPRLVSHLIQALDSKEALIQKAAFSLITDNKVRDERLLAKLLSLNAQDDTQLMYLVKAIAAIGNDSKIASERLLVILETKPNTHGTVVPFILEALRKERPNDPRFLAALSGDFPGRLDQIAVIGTLRSLDPKKEEVQSLVRMYLMKPETTTLTLDQLIQLRTKDEEVLQIYGKLVSDRLQAPLSEEGRKLSIDVLEAFLAQLPAGSEPLNGQLRAAIERASPNSAKQNRSTQQADCLKRALGTLLPK